MEKCSNHVEGNLPMLSETELPRAAGEAPPSPKQGPWGLQPEGGDSVEFVSPADTGVLTLVGLLVLAVIANVTKRFHLAA